MLPAFLTTLLFSISAVCAHRSTTALGGTEANLWRILLAAFFLGLYAHLFGQGLSGKAFPWFLLSGCVGFGLGDLALYHALPRLGSRLSIMLVHCLAAPFAGALEWLWLGVRLTVPQALCAFLILAGVAVALAPSEHFNLAGKKLFGGSVCGVLAAMGQGFGAVLSRRAYQVSQAAGETIDGLTAAYQRILAGVVVATVFYGIVRWAHAEREPRRVNRARVFPWVVANALAGPALGVGFFQWALATTPTGLVMPIVALTPLVIIPLARVTEREQLNVRSLAGGAVAVAGAVLLTILR